MIARNRKNDYDDNVNNDTVQGRSEEESEEKYQTKIIIKDALASDILEHGGGIWKNKERLVKNKIIEEDDDDTIHSDNDRDTNNE